MYDSLLMGYIFLFYSYVYSMCTVMLHLSWTWRWTGKQAKTKYYPLVQIFSSAHRQIRVSVNYPTSAKESENAINLETESHRNTDNKRKPRPRPHNCVLVEWMLILKSQITWGNGTHLLPGTWPPLIPFRGSGATPSNLEYNWKLKLCTCSMMKRQAKPWIQRDQYHHSQRI